MGSKTKKQTSIREEDEMLNNLDFEPVLKSKLRQVRWLHNNSNKCTMVYDEKLVRIMVHRLQEKIKELETKLAKK